ncbi:actin cytoskeleton-regulatory complex protein PAN1-like [Nomascus leucogenys]|uniref:actin cytoskeleton-regulatory complex protein PAN1-like n=1 Tax=Nomascus leucogenys TaxID=61853 RepID=UPI00122D7ECA|nr:actin cytoskeleton-regulatory complex protein PAN1-like [Nomascus leucogenys]
MLNGRISIIVDKQSLILRRPKEKKGTHLEESHESHFEASQKSALKVVGDPLPCKWQLFTNNSAGGTEWAEYLVSGAALPTSSPSSQSRRLPSHLTSTSPPWDLFRCWFYRTVTKNEGKLLHLGTAPETLPDPAPLTDSLLAAPYIFLSAGAVQKGDFGPKGIRMKGGGGNGLEFAAPNGLAGSWALTPLSRQPRPAAPRESLRPGAGFGPAAPPSHPEAPGDSRGRAEARGAGAGRGRRGAYRPEAYRRPPTRRTPPPGPRRPLRSPHCGSGWTPARPPSPPAGAPEALRPPASTTRAPAPLTLSFSARGLAWAGESPASRKRARRPPSLRGPARRPTGARGCGPGLGPPMLTFQLLFFFSFPPVPSAGLTDQSERRWQWTRKLGCRCYCSPLGSGESFSLSSKRGEDHIFILETKKCSQGR